MVAAGAEKCGQPACTRKNSASKEWAIAADIVSSAASRESGREEPRAAFARGSSISYREKLPDGLTCLARASRIRSSAELSSRRRTCDAAEKSQALWDRGS